MLISILLIARRLIDAYSWVIVIWAILSWVPMSSFASLVQDIREVLDRLVSPYINLFRRYIPPFGGIDFSPMVALIVLEIVRNFLG